MGQQGINYRKTEVRSTYATVSIIPDISWWNLHTASILSAVVK